MCLSHLSHCRSNAMLLTLRVSHANNPKTSPGLTELTASATPAVLLTVLECLNIAEHCAVQVSCNLHGRGERKRKIQRKKKGAVALRPPLPSAPSPSTHTLQAACLPGPMPWPAQQLGLDLGWPPTHRSWQSASHRVSLQPFVMD